MWTREADKVEAGYLQYEWMNGCCMVTSAVIDGGCQVSLTETSSVTFAVVRISGSQHRTKNITHVHYHTFQQIPWKMIAPFLRWALDFYLMHHQLEAPDVLNSLRGKAAQLLPGSNELFHISSFAVWRSRSDEEASWRSAVCHPGWGGGSTGSDPSWQEYLHALLLFLSIWTLSIIYNAYSLVFYEYGRSI